MRLAGKCRHNKSIVLRWVLEVRFVGLLIGLRWLRMPSSGEILP